jgi:FixJ family two-component response regulator
MLNPTVFLIDDDTYLARAVTRLLRTHGYGVQSFSSAASFLSHELPPGPGCLLLDLKMPEINGLDLQKILAHEIEDLPVIFMSGQADVESSIRAMKAGAVDFLLKPFDDNQLLAAVRSALSLSNQALSKREELEKDRTAFISLSPREQQVCLRIARGLLNKQVGYELGTAEKTVKVQRARIMQKLGAGSLPDVVRLVERLRTAGAIPADSTQPRHL